MKKNNSVFGFLNDKLHTPTWLFILLIIVFVFRIPSFFEPYSYGDEMIYLTLGHAIRQGIPLYSGVHDNKPPLLYIMAAIAGSLFWFKAILTLWMLVTIFIFWKLTEVLFPKNLRAQQFATIIFAILTTIPLLEGNIVNAELFMIGPTILGFFILLSRKLSSKSLFFAGTLFSVATLFKVPASFDIPAIVFFWLATNKLNAKNLKLTFKSTIILGLGFVTPILLTFIWYFLQDAFSQYLVAAFLQNVGYLSSWRPGDVQEPFLVRNLPLLIRVGVVVVGLLTLYKVRKQISPPFIIATVWLLLSLFAVTLSERPYPHYLIQSIPAVSILMGILFTHQNKEQVFTIIPLTLAIFVPYYFNFWRYPTLPYYVRFVRFVAGSLSRDEYINSYGSHVPTNYKIAEYLLSVTKKDEKIFVWGESSPIYALTRRLPPTKYVADYHIRDFSTPYETVTALSRKMPSFIVILPNAPIFPELETFLSRNYGLTETIDGATIWKLLGPKVRALIS